MSAEDGRLTAETTRVLNSGAQDVYPDMRRPRQPRPASNRLTAAAESPGILKVTRLSSFAREKTDFVRLTDCRPVQEGLGIARFKRSGELTGLRSQTQSNRSDFNTDNFGNHFEVAPDAKTRQRDEAVDR